MKKPMGQYLAELLSLLYGIKLHPLTLVETGTMRNPSESGLSDGHSTLYIARWVRESGVLHKFYSLELNAAHLELSRRAIHEAGLADYVIYGLGDAQLILDHFNQPLDFAYLDSSNDPLQNLLEFRRVEKWMRKPGLVVIDDVYDPCNANKGLLTIPIARLEGLKGGKLAERMAVLAFGSAAEALLDKLRQLELAEYAD